MIHNDLNYNRPRNKAVAGFILLTIGLLLLVKQTGFMIFPFWMFSWPMLLIVIGLFSGFKHNFRKPMWLILTISGVLFLIAGFSGFAISHLLLPVILIGFGLKMILGRNRYWGQRDWVNEMKYGAGINIPIE